MLWMTMDSRNASNTLIYDNSTWGNNGTVVGNATYTSAGKRGGAYSFDGASGYVDVGNSSVLIDAGNKTFSLWYNPQSNSSGGYLLTQYDGSGLLNSANGKKIIFNANKTIGIRWAESGSDMITTDTIPLNSWTHITVVFGSGSTGGKIYFNGVEVKNGNLGVESIMSNNLRICGRWKI